MIPAEAFQTASLRAAPEGEAITRILAAAIAAAEPGEAVRRSVRREGDLLTISGQTHDLRSHRRLCLLAIGKASVGMSAALADLLGGALSAGLVITKHAPPAGMQPFASPVFTLLEGDHPLPGERSLRAGEKVVEFVSGLAEDDLLFCLLSGGGSALVTAPAPGVNLPDLQVLTSELLRCGAGVGEINSLRRRLDRLKGGGLARLANGAAIISLVLSDVVDNPLEAVASGPTAPDPATREGALSTLAKYKLMRKTPQALLDALESAPETPKPGDPLFDRVQNVLVGSNLTAAQGALKQAQEEGFHPYLLRADLQGEARQAAFELATFLRQAAKTGDPVPRPACILAGGETTVTVTGKGKGGRNTELALAAVSELAGFPGVILVTLATDGEDGATDAAGAVVTGDTHRRARGQGLRVGEHLQRNDSYTFFENLGDLLKPGVTGTNVNDLTLLFSL